MKKTIAALVFGGLVFNSGFAAVHSVGSIPQKAEGDFLLAGEINTILKTISGIFFDDSNGNVGIGVSNPSAPLEIQSGGDKKKGLLIRGTDQVGSLENSMARIGFTDKEGNLRLSMFYDTDNGDLDDSVNSELGFDYFSKSGTINRLAVFRGDGNVGIGTVNPLKKLDVAGDLRFNYNALIAGFDSSIDSNYDHIWVNDGDQVYGGNAIGNWVFAHDGGYKGAGNSALVAGNVWMRGSSFDNYFAGNVGIGTVNPLKKLDIAGDVRFNYNALIAGFDSSIDSNYDHIWVNDGDQVYGGNAIGNWVFAHDGGYKGAGNSALVAGNVWMRGSSFDNYFAGNVGIGTTSPSEKLHVSGNIKGSSFMYSSDRTKKQNIKSLKNALEVVQNLRGVEFEWKENGQKSIGFLAQEVEEILPELVHGAEGEKSVEYGNLTAILVEAVKAQQSQIEAQNARISALELQVSK